jgi:HlyD family secretion protein
VKAIVIILLVVGALGAAIWYFKTDHSEPPQYQTAAAARGDLTQTVTANGTLNPVLNVQVGSQISGNILKLFADFNSLVKSNQVVAQLDPAIFEASLHQAEGDLANARAALELAQVNAKRSAELMKSNLIPESDNDKAIADLHQAEAQVKIKIASVERAQLDLSHCTIYAPVDGIVISRNVDVGQTVAASMNAPTLFVIANDLAKMQIDSNVSEADVGTIEDGQTANFTVDAFPNRNFVGKVTQIRNSPVVVQNVVTYDTVIEVSNPDGKLKPGMTATISITTAQRSGVLKIPNAALRFRPLEPSTNQTLVAKWLSKVGLGKERKPSTTNAVQTIKAGSTNKSEGTESSLPPLTGNEPPEELMKRVREMRDRGEEPPPEIRAKLRELFASGAIQRPGGGGPGGGGPGGQKPRQTQQPIWRNIYTLVTNTPSGGGDLVITPQPMRVKTGITDGAYTEITDGLKDGDVVITAVKLPASQQAAMAPQGASPFGGGGGGGGRRF